MDNAMLRVVLTSIIVVASITCAVKLLNWLWFRPRKLEKFLRKQGLNGISYRPFLGDLKDFMSVMKQEQSRSIQLSDDILQHISPYHQKNICEYGQNSFMWFGPYPVLNIMDPELIKEIIWKPDVFEKGLTETGKFITGGIAFLEGEKWAKRRKIINPAFHLEKLKNMVPAMGLSCSNMIHKWESMVSTSSEGCCEIDVWPYLEDLTGGVISRTAFGSSYEDGSRIFQLQREKAKLTYQMLQLLFIPGWRYLPTRLNRKVKGMTNEIYSILRNIVDKRQKAMLQKEEAIPRDDLLGILLESNSRFIQEDGNKNAGMSIDDVTEECKAFYFAGAETTSCLLVWTMVLLCKHPEWQTQAREEVIRVFGDSEPRIEGINRLKTVTMILQEVLRLYPPATMLIRRAKELVNLQNLTIPAGVYMMLLISELHYDPGIWGDDAKEFKPQRFSEGVSNAAKIQSSFIPFGSGPRVCVGQNFAMIEAKMALAMILKRFSFELSPSYLHAPFAFTTLIPQYGAPLILHNLK